LSAIFGVDGSMVLLCPQLPGKRQWQAVKASSFAKARFSGELVAKRRNFLGVPHGTIQHLTMKKAFSID
jgi:hypothetical protein